jgi:hypothetical protein
LRLRVLHGFASQLPFAILFGSLQDNSENCPFQDEGKKRLASSTSSGPMLDFLFSRFVLCDGSFCRCDEYGSCPTSLVLLFQSGGALDQSALTGRERNAQVIILSFFRVFTLSSHTGSLNKEMSIP